MPKRAVVAYESKRRSKAALPKLRWHRISDGIYRAEKDGKTFTVFHRSPDRRHGKLPWVLTLGGVRGTEIKSFDTASDAKEFARCYNAQPSAKVIVQAAPGMPAGVYKGTAAEKASAGYLSQVIIAAKKMGVPYEAVVDDNYVAQMEAANVDPTIVAAVLAGTTRHMHQQRPYPHVEVFEGKEARRQKRDPGYIDGWTRPDGKYYSLRKSRNDDSVVVLRLDDELVTQFPAATPITDIKAWAATYDAGDYMGGAEGSRGSGVFRVYYKDEFGVSRMEWVEAPNEDEALRIAEAEAEAHGHAMRREVRAVPAAAEESKKRLWQPDPSTGMFLTHSSATRNTWVMKGDRILGRFDTRPEAEQFAKDLSKKE
jgi:hypothetical protein